MTLDKNHIIRRSAKVALIVGSLINGINYWDAFFQLPSAWTLLTGGKILLNFLVPFFVHLFLTEREISQKLMQFKRLEDESSRIIRFPPKKDGSDAA